jgi:hypothetical protein
VYETLTTRSDEGTENGDLGGDEESKEKKVLNLSKAIVGYEEIVVSKRVQSRMPPPVEDDKSKMGLEQTLTVPGALTITITGEGLSGG